MQNNVLVSYTIGVLIEEITLIDYFLRIKTGKKLLENEFWSARLNMSMETDFWFYYFWITVTTQSQIQGRVIQQQWRTLWCQHKTIIMFERTTLEICK